MRLSIPTIPRTTLILSSTDRQAPSRPEAIKRISDFLVSGNTAVLTGAGVSVDSGIRAYRGSDGRYMNANYKPIFYHELVAQTEAGHAFRQRYWLRSFLGYPPVRDALPNTTHFALAALQYTSFISQLITQNVDGLHHKALGTVWAPNSIREAILELHGTLHRVRCSHGHVIDRASFQDWLSAANPKWSTYVAELEKTGCRPRTNPDGDVSCFGGVSYNDFVVPDCPSCLLQDRRNCIHKPEVTFFGESIPEDLKERSFENIEKSDKLLVVGTTLATFSAFRLLKHAIEMRKPVLLLNIGPTRADSLAGVEKIEIASGSIIQEVAKDVINESGVLGDPVVQKLITSGVIIPPTYDDQEGDSEISHDPKLLQRYAE